MPLDMTDRPIFNHAKNITVGRGRIIYEPHPYQKGQLPGWVLPGGRITTDQVEATDAARLIERITAENKRP